MSTITTKLIVAGILGVLTLISGKFVSNAGRPLNSILFSIHKLIAVAAVVMIVISVVQLFKTEDARALLELCAVVLSVVLFAALVVTGGMLSFEREWPAVVLKVHQIAPLLSLGFSGISVFLLLSSRA